MIKKIHLKNFRRFDDLVLDVQSPLLILSGRNAAGKTTILEAIYLCSTSKSHRTNELNELITAGREYAVCEIEASKRLKMILSAQGKSLFINQREISKLSDFIGNLQVVMFSPYDLRLIQGSKAERRRFLDMELSLLDKSYLRASAAYKRLLKERNDLLKTQNIDMKYLDVLTKQLIEVLDILYHKRIEFIHELNTYLRQISSDMQIEEIRLEYEKTYGEDIYASFKAKEKTDILTRVTSIGSHRDDFRIFIDNLDAGAYASEGQIRTICIAIKLAVKEYITFKTTEEPVLLLDDVFAALDKNRIESLTKYVKRSRQTFITTTSILEIPDELLKNASVLRIDSYKKEIQDGKQQ